MRKKKEVNKKLLTDFLCVRRPTSCDSPLSLLASNHVCKGVFSPSPHIVDRTIKLSADSKTFTICSKTWKSCWLHRPRFQDNRYLLYFPVGWSSTNGGPFPNLLANQIRFSHELPNSVQGQRVLVAKRSLKFLKTSPITKHSNSGGRPACHLIFLLLPILLLLLICK